MIIAILTCAAFALGSALLFILIRIWWMQRKMSHCSEDAEGEHFWWGEECLICEQPEAATVKGE